MKRGFGVDADVPAEVAAEVARTAETLGYGSFWVNGSPPGGAFDVLEAAARSTSLQLGVGVLPLTRTGIDEIVEQVKGRSLPQDRLWLGFGSNRRPGALDEVRQAAVEVRERLSCRVVTGAVGPKMTQLAAETADCVLFTWWPRSEVARSRQLIAEAAADAGVGQPIIASYVRCALLPQAAEVLEEKASRYQAMDRYARVFERNNMTAAESVVTGGNRQELIEQITYEEVVIDLPIIRAITPDNETGSLTELVEACAP